MTSARDAAGATTAKNWFSSRWLAVGVLAATLIAPDVGAGQVSISEGGTPSMSVPVTVPPGIAGMAPNLALLYSGGKINGPIGYGWTMQGVSLITRCPFNKLVDGVAKGVDYSANDKLCLDGQRLIQTDASGNVVNGAVVNPGLSNPFQQNDSLGGAGMVREYRTEKELYARVRAYGYASGDATGASGPGYFKVWTKNGLVYEYGVNSNATANANVTAQGKSLVIAWPVSRVSDTAGNYMDFQYEQRDVGWGSAIAVNSPIPGREWNLLEVRYTGNGAQLPTNKVVFDYIDRPDNAGGPGPQDRSESYHKGSKNVSVRLLTAIRTYVNWPADQAGLPATAIKVKTVKLTYEKGPVTGRSRLTKIAECAGAAETACLPPVTMTYSNGGGTGYQADPTFKAGPLSTLPMQSVQGNYGVILGDFNGDGKTDVIRWSDNPIENQLLLSRADGGGLEAVSNFNLTTQSLVKSDGCFQSLVGDFNGDGLPDIFTYSAATNSAGGNCASATPSYIYFNNGNGTFNGVVISGPTLSRVSHQLIPKCSNTEVCHIGWTAGANFYVLDVNGDGRLDIVTAALAPLPNSGFSHTRCPTGGCTQVWLSNGDGSFTSVPTNINFVSIYTDPRYSTGIGAVKNTADIDGDGFADLTGLSTSFSENMEKAGLNSSNFTPFTAYISKGDGNFIGADSSSNCLGPLTSPIDFNGDLRSDCLVTENPIIGNQLFTALNPQSFQLVANFNLGTPGLELSGTGIGFQVADFNGDGRDDIIRWKDDSSQNLLYLSNGDGTFRADPAFNFSGIQLQKSDGTAVFILGDFRGRGNVEILRLVDRPSASSDATRNLLFVKTDSTPADQLVGVTSSTGANTTLTWVSLSNSSSGSLGNRYASDRATPQASAYPMFDMPSSGYAIATVTTDSGVGAQRIVSEYSYAGLKASYNGQGILGFRETRRQNPAPDGSSITVLTQYLQDANNLNLASMTETRLGALNASGAPVISRSTYVYCDKTAAAGAETSATNIAPCATIAKVKRPYLYKSVDYGWDLGGALLPKVTTINTFNNSGDPTQIVATSDGSALGVVQSFTKTTSNQYLADNSAGDNWILGRLQRATVASNVPNSLPSIATSAGSAPSASATQGQSLSVTIAPAALTVNAPGPGVASGTLTAQAGGGGAPYSYAWVRTAGSRTTAATSNAASAVITATLAAPDLVSNETWQVTVRDVTGATATASATISFTAPAPPPPAPPALVLTACSSVSPATSPAAASTRCTLSNSGQTATASISYSGIAGASVAGPTGVCGIGAVCGTVTVTTSTAAGNYVGTLTATPNAGSAASVGINLTVNPPIPTTATITLNPTSITLATIAKGTFKQTGVVVTNAGAIAATGLSVSVVSNPSFAGSFTGSAGNCSAQIGAGASCSIAIMYSADCVGGTVTGLVTVSGSNFTTVTTTLNASTKSTGSCL